MNPRFPFSPFPNGWFAIARSSDLPPKGVMPVRYFGQELALFRTEMGEARMVDAFCPHLGAHLGHGGKVEGQNLRCPFHGWCFDGDSGRCVDIPFAKKIPPRARLGTWTLRETDGIILAYRDVDGQPPTWEVPSIHTPAWTDAFYVEWKLRTCCQEILENTVDSSHLPTVHDARRPARYVPGSAEGPVLHHKLEIQWDGAYIGAPGTEMDVQLEVNCQGIGIINVDTYVASMGMRARQRLYVTPIDDHYVRLLVALHVQRMPSEEVTQSVDAMWRNAFQTDFVKDFPIWENKAYLAQPMLSEADGPIALLRRWAKQFYPTPAVGPVHASLPQAPLSATSAMSAMSPAAAEVAATPEGAGLSRLA